LRLVSQPRSSANNVFLVDGTYELFRAYYGAPKRANASGREVGAASGFFRTLRLLLRDEAVTHVACAFDHVIESFRNDLFAGYKTGDGIEPELRQQFDLVEDVSRALGIVTWPMVEFEADDALASAAARFAAEDSVGQVVIASPDKDLTQCVTGNRVVCWDRRRHTVLDELGVKDKFGVSPVSIPDYLALVGDAADGIPGIFGWGKKSAAQLLERYVHIEAIPDEAAAWDVKPRRAYELAANLRDERELALLYRELATLRRDVPLDENLDALEWRGAVRERVEALADELDDADLLADVPRFRDRAET
jgi:5'-3' exonuclease